MSGIPKLVLEHGANLVGRQGISGRLFGFAIDFAILTVIAVFVAKLFWVLMTPVAFMDNGAVRTSQSGAFAGSSLAPNVNLIERFNPFDRGLSAVSIAEAVEEAPETALNLQIKSLMSSTDSEQSFVRLELPNNSTKRFQAGDTILNGVELERILSDRIILLRQGQREILYATETKVITSVTPDGEPVIDPTPKAVPTGPIVSDPVDSEASTSSPKTVEFSSLEALNEELNDYLLRVKDKSSSDRVLTIVAGADEQILTGLGLSTGDQLRQVNGFDLVNGSLSQAYEQLKDERLLEFGIRRDGDDMTVTIEIGNE